MTDNATLPPPRFTHFSYHWLGSPRADPRVAEWDDKTRHWLLGMERIIPEEMYLRGWRYIVPCLFPISLCDLARGRGLATPSDDEMMFDEQQEKVEEVVDHPAHYGGADNSYEVIKVLQAWFTPDEFIGFLKGNAIKYEARHRQKNGLEDLRKAEWYATRLVEFIAKQETKT